MWIEVLFQQKKMFKIHQQFYFWSEHKMIQVPVMASKSGGTVQDPVLSRRITDLFQKRALDFAQGTLLSGLRTKPQTKIYLSVSHALHTTSLSEFNGVELIQGRICHQNLMVCDPTSMPFLPPSKKNTFFRTTPKPKTKMRLIPAGNWSIGQALIEQAMKMRCLFILYFYILRR